jgi:DNA-nicking Smr family endonuclease
VSKVDDIKNLKRQQKKITLTQVLVKSVGNENNVSSNKENNQERKEEKKVERKRVSFDLRIDLHKELKMQSILQEKNIYLLIEEAVEKYLYELKGKRA